MKWLFWPALGNTCGNCSPKLKDTYTVTIAGLSDIWVVHNGTWTLTQTGTAPSSCIWTYNIDANNDVILHYISGKWVAEARYVSFFIKYFRLTVAECDTPLGSYTPDADGTCVVSA